MYCISAVHSSILPVRNYISCSRIVHFCHLYHQCTFRDGRTCCSKSTICVDAFILCTTAYCVQRDIVSNLGMCKLSILINNSQVMITDKIPCQLLSIRSNNSGLYDLLLVFMLFFRL